MTSLFHHPTGARMLSAIALALLASCGGGGGDDSSGGPLAPSAAPVVYTTPLSGSQEVPPTASAATATGTLTLDPATRAFSATIGTSGIAGTMAHIHQGAVGVNGPIIFPLTESEPGKWTTSGTFTEAQLGVLNAGNYYFNVHSAALPSGEIRGQINAAPVTPAPAPAPMPETDGDGY